MGRGAFDVIGTEGFSGVGGVGSPSEVLNAKIANLDNEREKQIFAFVKSRVDKALAWRAQNNWDKNADLNEARFKAIRSIRGLDYGSLPKTKPWPGASDIGIPIDAITIQSIVARADRVEWERFPLTHVTGVGPSDQKTALKIGAFLDWQKSNRMRLRIPKMMGTRRACIDGSYFHKMVFENDFRFEDDEIFALLDPDTKKFLRDELGDLVEWNPDEPSPLNESSKPFQVVPGIKTTRRRPSYQGVRSYGRNIKQILWAEDETDPDLNRWEWIGDMYYRSTSWLNDHSEDVIGHGGMKNIKKLMEMRGDKTNHPELLKRQRVLTSNTNRKDTLTDKVFIVEFHGKFTMDGKERDIVAMYAPLEAMWLGWEFDEFVQKTGLRQFVHKQIIPMDGQVVGMSVIDFIRGLRNTIDVIFNQMMDRGARNNNPPIVYVKGSGFNPNVHNFGYRFWPEKEKNSLRVMELPKGESIEFAKLEMLMGLVQRLFGVTDTTAGIENPANQTATGITTLLAEGNVNIDMILSILNEGNIMMDKLIIKLNALRGPETQEFPIIDSYSEVMEDPDNPFESITREELMGDYNYASRGSTLTVNTRSFRQESMTLYQIVQQTKQANVFLNDLNVEREVTNDLFKSFDRKAIRLKTVEQAQQEIQAAQEAELQAAQQAAGEGGQQQ